MGYFQSPIGLKVRGPDRYASEGGDWGAARTSSGRPRKHEGVDILTIPSQPIVSPADALFVRVADPYHDRRDSELLGALLVDRGGTKIKILYMKPIYEKIGETVKAGEVIGHAQTLQHLYPGIQDHIHVEVWSADGMRVDPRPYFVGLRPPSDNTRSPITT